MDNVIDKLLLEWSWRCEKGYPDINNPADKKVLDKLLAEYKINLSSIIKEQEKQEGLDDQVNVDSIIKLLASKQGQLTDTQKTKIYKIIEKTGKGFSQSLYEILLEKKKLTDQQASLIVGYADRVHIEDKIIESIQNSNNTFSNLGNSGNLVDKLKEFSGINEKHLNQIIKFTIAKTKNIGRGELALISLLYDTSAALKGDVEIADGTVVEIKATGSSGTIVAPDDVVRGGKDYPLAKIRKVFSEKLPKVLEVEKMTQTPWPSRLEKVYNTLTKNEKNEFYNGLVKLTDTLYGEKTVDVSTLKNVYTAKSYKELVAKALAMKYLKDKKVLFISPDNRFILLDGNNVENQIGGILKIGGFSDVLPRISYFGDLPSEEE